MTARPIIHFPNAVLRKPCTEVTDFDDENDELKTLCRDMLNTMEYFNAQGLAAPQVGVSKRVFAAKIEGQARIFINPEIVDASGVVDSREGCLSFPGASEILPRFRKVTVKANDILGDEFQLDLEDSDAVAIQHELDHLNGVLFIDKISPLKKRLVLKRSKKMIKRHNL